MSKDWIKVKLGDLVGVKHGFAFKGAFFTEKPNMNYLLTPGNFKIGGGFQNGKPKYYEGSFPEDYILKPADVVITMTDLSKIGDTLGYPALIPNDGLNYLHNQRIGLVVFKSTSILKEFLYFRLRNYDYQKYIVNSSTGSTVKHTSPSSILRFEFLLPSLVEQEMIAKALSTLDKKIDINNQINEKLQEYSHVLYKRWFVDYEFPDENGNPYKSSGGKMVESELGMVPAGWFVKKQGDFFQVVTGKKNANYSNIEGEYKFFTCSQQVFRSPGYSFEGSAILVAGNGDFNVKFYRGRFEAYQRTYVLIPFIEELSGFFYFAISANLAVITSGHRGSVINFITKGDIQDFKMALPSNEVLISMTKRFTYFVLKIQNNNEENDKLAEIRELLLPKFMSGEISIPLED